MPLTSIAQIGSNLNTFAMVRAGSTDATVAVEFHNVYGEMIEAKSGTGTATVTVSSTAKSLAK
ncbi:MAG: hypothetical protein WAO58_10700, partial [Fimbriimonadaceae bacterium]